MADVLFIGETFTATAMGRYEHAIARAAVLSLFVPLIISSGGNSGSQATSILIRSLALQEVKLRDWWRVLNREIISGLGLGLFLGVIGLVRICMWHWFGWQHYDGHPYLMAITGGTEPHRRGDVRNDCRQHAAVHHAASRFRSGDGIGAVRCDARRRHGTHHLLQRCFGDSAGHAAVKSQAAEQIFRKHGGEFHFAAQFLPAVKRDAAAALFAFCKLIVDATSDDSCGEKTAMVRARIDAVFAGEIELPRPGVSRPDTARAVGVRANGKESFRIPRQTMLDFVESKRIEQTVTRYATWNSLRKYCELSAGSIAVAASCIVGLTNPDARPKLVDLAVAMRLDSTASESEK
jgi:hypothetical protein